MSTYFDVNATTVLCPTAREAWLEASQAHWHNPSGLYREAGTAKRFLEEAREELGGILDCDPARILFCSGATEANNAIFHHAVPTEKPVLFSAVEHPSVREPALQLANSHEIPVTPRGGIDLSRLEEQVASMERPALVSVMAANNETGILLPWGKIADLCRQHGVSYHCDASQWIGKLPAAGLGACAWVTGCAHKFGGPKGVGFAVIPEENPSFAMAAGGPQESGRRAGTENLPGILAMLAALREKPDASLESAVSPRQNARDSFEKLVATEIPGTIIVGAEADRLWNTSMLIMPRHRNLKWLTRLTRLGFAVSTGSACSAGKGNPSRVMEAMGLTYTEMERVLRVSGSWDTSATDWALLAEAFSTVWNDLESGKRPTSILTG